MNDKITISTIDISTSLPLPLADAGIKAGFPSPAQDYMDIAIDLNQELVRHPSTTFYGRVRGDSMQDAHVFDGDILVIDKSLEPQSGDMAVCYIDGEFTIKYIEVTENRVSLIPANPLYPTINVTADQDLIIWGVVTYVIHKAQKRR
ncbi:LexA family protein [Bacteroides propionicifaciens]|jgi:DNA polymerase V|uniref:LexA family protein n=1 Tax=Bacteroides propionicifaciens TaxID=392838 RepID=UPI0003659890|nr:translesion error-prone DNA polymerase V autoproteolytic subunit [Bacteroides propionicifaciens]